MKYVPAIGLATGMLIALGFSYGMGFPSLSGLSAGQSQAFGPEWTCVPHIRGGPICWRPAQ